MDDIEALKRENAILKGLLRVLWEPEDTFAQKVAMTGYYSAARGAAARYVNDRDALPLGEAIHAANHP